MSQKGLAPILIVILIAAAVGGYFIYQKQIKPVVVPQQTAQPSSTNASPAPTGVGEIANWKTYTNTKVGFQIKYPPRYSKPGLPSGAPTAPALYADGNEESGTILFGNPSGINEDGFILDFYSFTGTLDKLSLDMSYGQPYDFSGKNNNYDEDNVLITRKELLIDGKPALSLTKKYIVKITGSEVGSPYMGIFFINRGYGFGIIADRKHDAQEVNQILSTFKFSNQSPPITDVCANKTTYKSLEEALKEPNKVCYLDLSRKNLAELPKEVLQFENLKDLYLNFNKLTTLSEDIKNLKNLTSIDLTGNPITIEETNRIRSLLPKIDILNIQPMNLPQ